MFWIASARPNTSRPQPFTCDIGVRKKPSVARGPKLIREIRQRQSTTRSGVRQPIETLELEGNEMAMCHENPVCQIPGARPVAFNGSCGHLQPRLAHGRRAASAWKSAGAGINGCGLYVSLGKKALIPKADVHPLSQRATAIIRCGSASAMTRSLLCPHAFLSPLEIDAAVTRALGEDPGRAGDVTAIATIPEETSARAIVVARAAGVIAGLPLVAATFAKLALETQIAANIRDGASVAAKTELMTVTGPARA